MCNALDNLPRRELFSSLTNIPNLIVADVDYNVLSQVDFNYYSVNDFQISESIGQIFSSFLCINKLSCSFTLSLMEKKLIEDVQADI